MTDLLGSLDDTVLRTYRCSADGVRSRSHNVTKKLLVVPVNATDLLRMIYEIEHYRSLGSNTGASHGVRERLKKEARDKAVKDRAETKRWYKASQELRKRKTRLRP